MTNKLMLGVAISALTISGAFAQSPTMPGSNTQSKPPAAASAKPDANAPAAKQDKTMDKSTMDKSTAKPESSAANKSDKAKIEDKAAANTPADTKANEPKIVSSQSPDQFLASNFKGTDVIGSNGKKIGDVSDILFEKDGTIQAYVVSFGGFLGMGAKEVAIAPAAFEVVPGKKGEAKKLKLSMSQQDLKAAQKFTEYKPPQPASTTGSGGGTMGGAAGGGAIGGGMHPSGGMGSSAK